MAGKSIEGSLDGLSETQIDFITKTLDKNGFRNAKVVIKPVGKAGDNYAADVRRIIASKDDKELRLIVKIASKIETMRDTMQTKYLFHNETKIYENVLPKFAELETEAGIEETDRLKFVKLYGASLEELQEIMLLEDLQVDGYVMLDRFKTLTDDVVRLILKNFAKIHGYGYVLRKKDPSFDDLLSSLHNMWASFGQREDMKEAFGKMEADIIKTLDNEDYSKLVKGKVSRLGEIAVEMSREDGVESQNSTLLHGDAWTNNILFQIKDDKASSCCMIDYQLSRLGSPVIDIGNMIFMCTDYETRMKNYQDWLDYYHSQLSEILQKFDLDVNLVYSRERLDCDLKRYGELSIGQCLFASNILVKEPEEAERFKQAMEKYEAQAEDMDQFLEQTGFAHANERTIAIFREKVSGIIKSHIELGYLHV